MIKSIQSICAAFRVIAFFIRKAASISKISVLISVILPIVQVIGRYTYIVFPALIISEMTQGRSLRAILVYGAIMISLIIATNILKSRLTIARDINNVTLCMGFQNEINNIIMDIDYAQLEDPAFLDLRNEVMSSIHDRDLLTRLISNIQNFIVQAINIASFSVVLSVLNPLLIVTMLVLVIFGNLLTTKAKGINLNIEKVMNAYTRRVGYFESLTSDSKIGKEARVYNLKGMLVEEIDKFNRDAYRVNRGALLSTVMISGLLTICEQLQMLVVYLYIAYRVVIKSISLGDFTMYTGAAVQLGQSVFAMVNAAMDYKFLRYYVDRLYELLNYKQVSHSPQAAAPALSAKEMVLQFHNVSFTYPRASQPTLKHINVTLRGNEHLSIVGENGAGKTTFIKLVCGLYRPTEGSITLNGEDIASLDPNGYRKLISVIFQDYPVFEASIAENVAFSDHEKRDDVWRALTKVGLADKARALPKQLDTPVGKALEKEGVELSGGEGQKLAIARALYKDAPILILDEPTAALDPYAEYEIVELINKISKEKLAIFISHRLSSCKFSQRILVFENGKIIQDGAHGELYKHKDQLYHKMYLAQAQYYQ